MKHYIQCVGCKTCYRECHLQMDAISITEDGVAVDLDLCNRCGHCVAVCPTGAMVHPLSPAQEPVEQSLSPEQVLHYLRSVRSVRHYRQDLVPKELLCQLLDAGRYAATAKNTQGVHYHVVRGRDKVQQVHDLYFECARSMPADHPEYPILIRPVNNETQKGFDALFYGCPQLIFAVCDKDKPVDTRSVQFSLTYIALMASSLGLGVCWAGQIQRFSAIESFRSQLEPLIGLPEDQRIYGCMMVGYPDVTFRRLVARDPLQVSWWEDPGAP